MKYTITGTVKNTLWDELGKCLSQNSLWNFSEMEAHDFFEFENEQVLMEVRLSSYPSIEGRLSFWFTGTYKGTEEQTKHFFYALLEALKAHDISYYFTFFDKAIGKSEKDVLAIHPNWNS